MTNRILPFLTVIMILITSCGTSNNSNTEVITDTLQSESTVDTTQQDTTCVDSTLVPLDTI